MVVDKGFEPFRCSPSDHSPGLIRPSRTPVLSTIEICGGRCRIQTYGFNALQALALGHSANRPYVVPRDGFEPPTFTLLMCYSTSELAGQENPGVHFCRGPSRVYYAACCIFNTSFKRSAA